MMRLESCGQCEECREGLICPDVTFAPCCYAVVEEAVSDCLNDYSEGMADPEIKAQVTYAVAHAIAGHQCDG